MGKNKIPHKHHPAVNIDISKPAVLAMLEFFPVIIIFSLFKYIRLPMVGEFIYEALSTRLLRVAKSLQPWSLVAPKLSVEVSVSQARDVPNRMNSRLLFLEHF